MKKIPFLLIAIIFLFSCNKSEISNSQLPDNFNVSNTSNIYDLVYGAAGSSDDELVSGMVADNSGAIYVSMNVTNAQANENIIVAKINTDGTLAWGQQYDATDELSPDAGENRETGGTANSISIDSEGNIYIIGTETIPKTGEAILIVKINSSTGEIMWQKQWKPEWPAEGGYGLGNQAAQGYAIDAQGDYVYFTGACGTNQIVVGAINKNDGSLLYQFGLDVVYQTKDRGYAIKQDATGNLFIGGVDGSYGIIAKINNGNTATPTLAWIKNPGLSFGARINGIDLDDSGVYFSCDLRGVETYFQIMKMDFDGNLTWTKIFPGTLNALNNTHSIYVSGDYVYAGGRTGQSGMDALGDALLIKVKKNTGDLEWSKIYYTGNANEESDGQRIKGIAVVGENIYVAGQIYPANANSEHYYGEWVENNSINLEDASVFFADISNATFEVFETGEVRDGTGTMSDYNQATLQNSKDKVAQNTPDCEAFMIKFKL